PGGGIDDGLQLRERRAVWCEVPPVAAGLPPVAVPGRRGREPVGGHLLGDDAGPGVAAVDRRPTTLNLPTERLDIFLERAALRTGQTVQLGQPSHPVLDPAFQLRQVELHLNRAPPYPPRGGGEPLKELADLTEQPAVPLREGG